MKKVLVGFSGNSEHAVTNFPRETLLQFLMDHQGASIKVGVDDDQWSVGGTSVDLAIGLKRHGHTSCRLLLTVGHTEDPPRTMLSRHLTDLGVDHHMFPVLDRTSDATVLSCKDGTTLVIGRKGKYLSYPDEEVKQQTAEFAPDAVVATGVVPADARLVTAMFRSAPESSLRVLNPRTELARSAADLSELLLQTHLLVINELEAAAILGRERWSVDDSLTDLHVRYSIPHVIVTCGPEGAVLSTDGRIVFQPTVDCGPVIDPTGAGDSFHGGFLDNWLAGRELEYCMLYAAVSAGITVTRKSGSAIPTREEVERAMAQRV